MVKGGSELDFFEKHAARIQTEGFTNLNESIDFEIDDDNRLELSAPASTPLRTFDDLLTAVQISTMAQDRAL